MREFTSGMDFSEVDFATETAVGYPAETICDYAQREGLDMIVMSTHGRTGFMHVLIGSVAEHVVRHAHSPVLVVPASVKSRT
jgi:nucleotide-binding universal stress UspA family protein